jgi:alanine racemase
VTIICPRTGTRALATGTTVIPAEVGAALIIDLDAVAANFRLIRDTCPGARVGAAVKANAYGLGVGPVTRALAAAGCETFFVATPAEGAQLRALHDDTEIVVLNGPDAGGLDIFDAARLTPTLNSLEQIATWSTGAPAARNGAWLHVDTGMSRLGLGPNEVETLAAEPSRLHGIKVAGILSHLACADTPDHPMNEAQREAFDTARTMLAPLIGDVPASLANSSGAFLGPAFHYDMVRPGAALYGIRPSAIAPNPMLQVIDLYAKILQLRDVDTPMTVGYGAAHRVSGPRRIATLAAGYADGYPRAAGSTDDQTDHTGGNRMCAYIDGLAAPIAGRISMDLITIDVTDIPDHLCRPGQTVELLGPNASADELADAAGTIAYEVLSRLGSRLHVEYRGGAA